MRKILIILMIIFAILLLGCDKKNTENYNDFYKKKIKSLTNKDIKEIIVDDFDGNGTKEAFALVSESLNKKEGKFEIWFLSENKEEKILDEKLASKNNTDIILFEKEKKYIIINIAQTRVNKDMLSKIYYVDNDVLKECFYKKNSNIKIIDKNLYCLKSSYYQYSSELKQWIGYSEQYYHLYIDKEKIKEYKSQKISRNEFLTYSNAKGTLENIKEIIVEKFGKSTSYKMYFLYREDDTVDINLIVSYGNNIEKYYMTVEVKNGEIFKNTNLSEGNKE